MDKWDFILEHAEHSKYLKPIPDDWVSGEAGNKSCGDYVKFGLVVENGIIKEIRFQHSGCLVSRASSSVLAEMVEGKNVDEVSNISFQDLLDRFQGSIQTRLGCAKTAYDAFVNTIRRLKN